MSDLTLKPGKYTLRNGYNAVVRYVETELDVLLAAMRASGYYTINGKHWHPLRWDVSGHYAVQSDLDIVSEGWPIELVHSKWYRTNQNIVGRLERLPDWYEPKMTRRWLIRYPSGLDSISDANDGCIRLVEEVPEPEWAK